MICLYGLICVFDAIQLSSSYNIWTGICAGVFTIHRSFYDILIKSLENRLCLLNILDKLLYITNFWCCTFILSHFSRPFHSIWRKRQTNNMLLLLIAVSAKGKDVSQYRYNFSTHSLRLLENIANIKLMCAKATTKKRRKKLYAVAGEIFFYVQYSFFLSTGLQKKNRSEYSIVGDFSALNPVWWQYTLSALCTPWTEITSALMPTSAII